MDCLAEFACVVLWEGWRGGGVWEVRLFLARGPKDGYRIVGRERRSERRREEESVGEKLRGGDVGGTD